MFKVRDLHEGLVLYHHSDSDTTRDHIVFRITDGQHSIRHRFPINILPKDDTPPILINNMALEVPEGGSLLLEEYMLLASDLDSSDDYILYQILTAPRAGEVIRRSSPQLPGRVRRDLSVLLQNPLHVMWKTCQSVRAHGYSISSFSASVNQL